MALKIEVDAMPVREDIFLIFISDLILMLFQLDLKSCSSDSRSLNQGLIQGEEIEEQGLTHLPSQQTK